MAFNEEDNACVGFLGEECQEVEKTQFWGDFDDMISEKGGDDVVDLLPNDPFGMEFNMGMSEDPILKSLPRDPFGMDFNTGTTLATITGWMEDLSLKAYVFETDEANDESGSYGSNVKAVEDNGDDDSKYFAELNFVWTSLMEYQQENGENEGVDAGSELNMEGQYDNHTMLCGDMNALMCFGSEIYEIERMKDDSGADGGAAVDNLAFVLGYLNLGVKDLLSVERVCRSLRDAVQKDPYLWTSIYIDCPLSQNITNEDLLKLTDRAQVKYSRINQTQW